MKIDVNKISQEGLVLREDFLPGEQDLETGIIKFQEPLKVEAEFSKITNAVTVHLNINGLMRITCSRCLAQVESKISRNLELHYPVNRLEPIIDLDPDIREELILNYPLKPLCKADCKGLCPKCGKNLNEGGCSCGTT